MKAGTKRRKHLETVEKWLSQSRELVVPAHLRGSLSGTGVFELLIAVEQMVEYCKLNETDANLSTNKPLTNKPETK